MQNQPLIMLSDNFWSKTYSGRYNLRQSGTTDQYLLNINKRLESRAAFLDWNKQIMGSIKDQKGVKQGGVNSDHFYEILGNEPLSISQKSNH